MCLLGPVSHPLGPCSNWEYSSTMRFIHINEYEYMNNNVQYINLHTRIRICICCVHMNWEYTCSHDFQFHIFTGTFPQVPTAFYLALALSSKHQFHLL